MRKGLMDVTYQAHDSSHDGDVDLLKKDLKLARKVIVHLIAVLIQKKIFSFDPHELRRGMGNFAAQIHVPTNELMEFLRPLFLELFEDVYQQTFLKPMETEDKVE